MDEEYSAGSQDAEREMTRLWRAWRTVFEMLQDRVGSGLTVRDRTMANMDA